MIRLGGREEVGTNQLTCVFITQQPAAQTLDSLQMITLNKVAALSCTDRPSAPATYSIHIQDYFSQKTPLSQYYTAIWTATTSYFAPSNAVLAGDSPNIQNPLRGSLCSKCVAENWGCWWKLNVSYLCLYLNRENAQKTFTIYKTRRCEGVQVNCNCPACSPWTGR